MAFKFDILKTSDLFTTFTYSFNDWVYGRSPSIRKGAYAMLVSIFSRLISDNMPAVALGGKYTSVSSKNQIVVAILGAMRGFWMKSSPLRSSMDQVSADLTAEYLLKAMGQVYSTGVEGATVNDFDIAMIPDTWFRKKKGE